ncbi:nicotinamide/nicotinic acid mononucleotide adenylyltransferase-like [Silene latifolia]|uniref:nicotinamide/nicotinic acid mononucleotide adenylyltransferase-like n=1 Tax=Silene latifolia TaxID=37657 RepID=UPI003D77DBEB
MDPVLSGCEVRSLAQNTRYLNANRCLAQNTRYLTANQNYSILNGTEHQGFLCLIKVEIVICVVTGSRLRGLLSAEHCIQMCQLACRSLDFVMVDPWEAKQSTYQRTLTVLCRVKNYLCKNTLVPVGSLKVMLICDSDLLESFRKSFWILEQVQAIVRDFGVACIRRERQDVEKMLSDDPILRENQNNIMIVDEFIPNQISSTRIRDCISRGLSVKYLTADEVIAYIQKHHLYTL